MNSKTTRNIANSKDDKAGFKGKDIMPPDKLTVEDIQRALFNEYDLGCISPDKDSRSFSHGDIDYDCHPF